MPPQTVALKRALAALVRPPAAEARSSDAAAGDAVAADHLDTVASDSPDSIAADSLDPTAADSLDPAAVVAEAETAVRDVRAAAAWVDGDGEARLRTVATNEATPEGLTRRARRVLDALAAFRAAAAPVTSEPAPSSTSERDAPASSLASGEDVPALSSTSQTGDPPSSSASEANEPAPSDAVDHFHPGRTTLLGGDGISSDR